jgi:phosphoadenosine phosphosulfate reductase
MDTASIISLKDEAAQAKTGVNKHDLSAILRWAQNRYAGRIAFASSLGLEDQVIVDALVRHDIDIPVFTLDTGRLFPQAYDLLAKTEARYGIRIKVLFPEARAVESMVAKHGVNLFLASVEKRRECCRVRKVEPLNRALSGLSAWVTGLRREQADSRSGMDLVEWDEKRGLVKINPLADWSETDVRRYVKEYDVPYNLLHDRGYPSIGCACCTRAVEPGEDIRAGRWWWEREGKKECGLHGYCNHINDSKGVV